MSMIWWLLGGSGLAAGGLGLLAWFSGAGPILAVVRGVWAFLMTLLRYFGDGLLGITKRPVEMFACACLCIATLVGGIALGLAWTKHVREQAKVTVANLETSIKGEDNADEALARAAAQAREAAAAAERARQAEIRAPLALLTPVAVDPALKPAGVRKPGSSRAARKLCEQKKSVFDSLQEAFGGADSCRKR